MTPQELDAIEARAAKATKGPWETHLVDDTTIVSDNCEIGTTCDSSNTERDDGYNIEYERMEADADFIAHARQDIPDLLAALTAAKAENEVLRLLQEFAEDLAWRSYLGVAVLKTVLKKSKLETGADVSEKLLADIAIQYPHFPAKSALRPMTAVQPIGDKP